MKYGINHVSACCVYGSYDTEDAANDALNDKLSEFDGEPNIDDYEVVQLRESINEMVVTEDTDEE